MDFLGSTIETFYGLSGWYIGSAITSCYSLYYLFEVVKKPIIATKQNGKFSELIEKKMPMLKEKFWPTLWCIESRAQTIFAPFVRLLFAPAISYKRDILTLKDGGEICLDSLEPKEGSSPNTPTVIVLPGLTGSSSAEYVKGFASMASHHGIRVIVFNQRGIEIHLKTHRTFCGANYEDLIEVISHAKAKYKGSLLGAVGISLGGLILGNYLSSPEGRKTPLSCAMIVSAPWNVHLATHSIEKPILNLLLNKHLTSCLCDIVKRFRPILDTGKHDIDHILKSKTIKEFDSRYTVQQFGYKDITDFYNQATIHNKIHKVTIPLLGLSSADDPFQPIKGIPIDEANKMDNLCIVVTSRGGHIGFMEGILPINKEQYMYRIFGKYFKTMLLEDGIKYFKKEEDVPS